MNNPHAPVIALEKVSVTFPGGVRALAPTSLAFRRGDFTVRLGLPQDVTGIDEVARSPAYSTGVGLLLFARQQRPVGSGNGMRRLGNSDAGQLLSRVKGWFKGNL